MTFQLPTLAVAQNSGSPSASGSSAGFDFRAKAVAKETQRWTLQEWLAMKDRNRMMDVWLGMHAPSPYEFYLSGSYLSYNRDVSESPAGATVATSDSFRSYAGSVGAYALLMGLVGEYENNPADGYNDTAGSLNFRVLGNAVQGTHLILNYGLRTRHQDGVPQALSQQFAGADLDLYVMKYFGLHGAYRGFLPSSNSTLGDLTGARSEFGAFLDFGPVRVFGQWYSEKQESSLQSLTTKTDRTGVQSGLKIFF
jgi:hypothetical protein